MSEDINQNIKLTYELQIIKDGKVINSIKGNSKSFLRNFASLIRQLLINSNLTFDPKDENGNPINILIYYFSQNGTNIEIGTGTTPVTPTDYRLSNFLDRKLATFSSLLVESDKCSFYVYNDFTYTTDQTISEIGISSKSSLGNFILIVRDVLPTPINVPAGATLRVKYTFVFPV